MKLYALRIFVRDWPAACAFYGETLGLAERFRNDEIGWAEYALSDDGAGPCFGIERVEDGDAEGAALVGRFLGVSLSVEDIGATCEDLKNKGVVFSAAPETQPWGGSLAHFKDPDGNELTLLG